MDIFEQIESYESRPTLEWEGTFADYLKLVVANPKWASLAHSRVYDMVKDGGITVDDGGAEHFHFFDRDLFGIDEPLAQVVEYFKAAAAGSDVGKRILLLYGPPSSGKSQLVILLKRGLEQHTLTQDGAVFAIKGCPQNDNPLMLIPEELRHDFAEQTGIHVEGQPCPLCRLRLKEDYGGKFGAMKVRRIFFSEKERCGIGTFVPSDPKSQDIAELVGSIDLATVGDYGSESDPRAYRFDGELNVSNRGMMEFIEMLKADERFLYVLLTLSQEKNIKTGRFPLIYADECVVAHTNETEFNEFLANKKSEALHDRMIMVRIPYNLKLTQEEKIYHKLLRQTNYAGVHIAPHALNIAAVFAILTRLTDPIQANLTIMKKLKLHDGEDVEGFRQKDVKLIKEASPREGMDGISPRFIINRIAVSLIKPDTTCINPIDVLRAINEGINKLPDGQLKKTDRERYGRLIGEARKHYDETARTDVQKAFFVSFPTEAEALVDNYLDNVEAYLEKTKLLDPITGEEVPPDEKLMRSIEEKVQVADSGKESFRNEIFRKVAVMQRAGGKFDYTSHEKLKDAIEKQLFEERRGTIKMTITSRNPDKEQLKKLNEVVETLTTREGYCADCANELLKYVSSLLAQEK